MTNYELKDGKILTNSAEIEIYGEYDVVVVGGGMAGVGAAVSAAKHGAKTIVIENTSALGGIATNGIVNIPLDFLSGTGKELFDELILPPNVLRAEGDLFLCGMSLEELSQKLNVKIRLSANDGAGFVSAMLGL